MTDRHTSTRPLVHTSTRSEGAPLLALWRKTVGEAAPLVAGGALVVGVFTALYLQLSSKIDLGALGFFLDSLPDNFVQVSSIDVKKIATAEGVAGLAYVHPIVTLTCIGFAITRGSMVVSGELARGSMEMLLAQPIRRLWLVLVPMLVMLVGSVALAAAVWTGTWAGLELSVWDDTPPVGRFLPAVVNLAGFTFAFCGIGTLVGSIDRYRWRTVGVMLAFTVVSIITQVLGRLMDEDSTAALVLKYTSILSVYEPQVLIDQAADAWGLCAKYAGLCFLIGTLCFAAATAVFTHRDLPAPL